MTGRTRDGPDVPGNSPHAATGSEDGPLSHHRRGPGRRVPDRGRMILTTVYLRPDQYDALCSLVDKTGAPMAYYVREAINAVLARETTDGEEQEDEGPRAAASRW